MRNFIMRGLSICLTIGLLSLAGCGSQQQTESDLPTLRDMASGASLRQYQQQRDHARQIIRQAKNDRTAETTSASPDRTAPYRVNVQLMYFPMLEPKLNLWLNDLKKPDLSDRTLEAYKANGFGIGEVDRSALRLFLANLEDPFRIKLTTLPISQFVTPITLANVDRRTQIVNVVDQFGKAEKQRILTGRYQLLVKLVPPDGVLTEGQTPVLDLIPHHEGPRAAIVPAAATDIAERGKAFDMLHIVKPIPTGKAWVVWAPVPDGEKALRTNKPLQLGRAMMHGFYRNRPAQLVALIVPTESLPEPNAPEPGAPTQPENDQPTAETTGPERQPESEPAKVVEQPLPTPEIEVVMVQPTPVPTETAADDISTAAEATASTEVLDAGKTEAELEVVETVPVEVPAEPETIDPDPVPVEVVIVEAPTEPVAPDASVATETDIAAVPTEPEAGAASTEPEVVPVETMTTVVEVEPTPVETVTVAEPVEPAKPAPTESAAPTVSASPAQPLPSMDGMPIDPFGGGFRAGGVRVRTTPQSSN